MNCDIISDDSTCLQVVTFLNFDSVLRSKKTGGVSGL